MGETTAWVTFSELPLPPNHRALGSTHLVVASGSGESRSPVVRTLHGRCTKAVPPLYGRCLLTRTHYHLVRSGSRSGWSHAGRAYSREHERPASIGGVCVCVCVCLPPVSSYILYAWADTHSTPPKDITHAKTIAVTQMHENPSTVGAAGDIDRNGGGGA